MAPAIVGGGDTYAVDGNSPEIVADFVNDYYRKAGVDCDFSDLLTNTGGSSGASGWSFNGDTGDALSIPAANISPSATAISLQIDAQIDWDGAIAEPLQWYTNTSNFLILRFNSAKMSLFYNTSTGSSADYSDDLAGSISAGIYSYNMAMRCDFGTDANAALNGTADTAQAIGDRFLLMEDRGIDFHGPTFSRFVKGTIGLFRLWEDVGLTDAQLEEATT